MHMGVWGCPLRAEESVRSPEAGVTGAWELPDMDAGIDPQSSLRIASALNC